MVCSALALSACAVDGAGVDGLETTGAFGSPIVGGTRASAYSEAALIDVVMQVNANGGFGTTTPPPPLAPTCDANETEPNNTYTVTDSVCDDVTCDALSTNDRDWFRFAVASAGRAYRLRAESNSLELRVWKTTNIGLSRVPNLHTTEVANTASSAGTYIAVVFSPSGATGTYRLGVQR